LNLLEFLHFFVEDKRRSCKLYNKIAENDQKKLDSKIKDEQLPYFPGKVHVLIIALSPFFATFNMLLSPFLI